MGREWDGSGTEVGHGSGAEVGREWDGNGTGMGWKCGRKWDASGCDYGYGLRIASEMWQKKMKQKAKSRSPFLAGSDRPVQLLSLSLQHAL